MVTLSATPLQAPDHTAIGTTLQLVGDHWCESIEPCAGDRVLDVHESDAEASPFTTGSFDAVLSTPGVM